MVDGTFFRLNRALQRDEPHMNLFTILEKRKLYDQTVNIMRVAFLSLRFH